MRYDTVLFDLDGTLTDPGEGITNSVAYALRQFGIENTDRTQLYKFIGPPLKQSFMQYYGFSDQQAEEAVAQYRVYFAPKGLFENKVYPGVPQLLAQLRAKGYKLLLATSKPEGFAVQILEHFGLLEYFDLTAGATMDSTRSKKADVIAYALDSCGIKDLSTAIMIGDREHDILGAKQTGLASIGVLYGYGNREEFEAAGATYIAETPADILTCIAQHG